MNASEVDKSIGMIVIEIIEYVPNSVVTKSIIKKSTGSISAVSLDMGEGIPERVLPFDSFVQIIDGEAEIIIDGVNNYLGTGQSIVIPAHSKYTVNANVRFKMILTIIKCGYE